MCAAYLKFRKHFASYMTNINYKLKPTQMSGEKISKTKKQKLENDKIFCWVGMVLNNILSKG